MKQHKHQGARYKILPWGKYYICDDCEEMFQSWKRKPLTWWYKYRTYASRGEMFISDINGVINVIGGLGVGLLLIDKWTGHMFGAPILIGIWLFQKVLVTYLGYMDYNYWKIFQQENILIASFTPPLIETLERLRNIEKKVCDDYKKDSILDVINKEHENK